MASSPSITIRQLGADDVDLFRQLLAVFAAAFEEHETNLHAQPDDDYLSSLLGGETFIAVAAIEDGAVVGGLAGYELKKFEQTRSEIYVHDLAVDARRRRQGVATALFGELKEIAVARGVHLIFVQAEGGDAPAVALYSKLGAREDIHHFDIRIAAD